MRVMTLSTKKTLRSTSLVAKVGVHAAENEPREDPEEQIALVTPLVLLYARHPRIEKNQI